MPYFYQSMECFVLVSLFIYSSVFKHGSQGARHSGCIYSRTDMVHMLKWAYKLVRKTMPSKQMVYSAFINWKVQWGMTCYLAASRTKVVHRHVIIIIFAFLVVCFLNFWGGFSDWISVGMWPLKERWQVCQLYQALLYLSWLRSKMQVLVIK